MFRAALAALLVFAIAGPAHADARQELHDAFTQNLGLKAFKASMIDLSSKRAVSTVEFQAPDRFRVTAAGRPPSVIIGDTMYISNEGRTMKVPLPKAMLGKFRNEAAIADMEKGIKVESIGPGVIGAEAARKYRFNGTGDNKNSTTTVWVGVRDGYVLQVETSGNHGGKPYAMRVLYSDFNSPAITITAPN